MFKVFDAHFYFCYSVYQHHYEFGEAGGSWCYSDKNGDNIERRKELSLRLQKALNGETRDFIVQPARGIRPMDLAPAGWFRSSQRHSTDAATEADRNGHQSDSDSGVELDLRGFDSRKTSLLHHAARVGALELVRAIVGTGAPCDIGEPNTSTTPLMFATIYEHVECARVLLAGGADANMPCQILGMAEPMTPLEVAGQGSNKDLMQALLGDGQSSARDTALDKENVRANEIRAVPPAANNIVQSAMDLGSSSSDEDAAEKGIGKEAQPDVHHNTVILVSSANDLERSQVADLLESAASDAYTDGTPEEARGVDAADVGSTNTDGAYGSKVEASTPDRSVSSQTHTIFQYAVQSTVQSAVQYAIQSAVQSSSWGDKKIRRDELVLPRIMSAAAGGEGGGRGEAAAAAATTTASALAFGVSTRQQQSEKPEQKSMPSQQPDFVNRRGRPGSYALEKYGAGQNALSRIQMRGPQLRGPPLGPPPGRAGMAARIGSIRPGSVPPPPPRRTPAPPQDVIDRGGSVPAFMRRHGDLQRPRSSPLAARIKKPLPKPLSIPKTAAVASASASASMTSDNDSSDEELHKPHRSHGLLKSPVFALLKSLSESRKQDIRRRGNE